MTAHQNSYLVSLGEPALAHPAEAEPRGNILLRDLGRIRRFGVVADLAVSVRKGSVLLMDGYVSDASGFSAVADADQNCAALHDTLERLSGLPELGAWLSSAYGSYALIHIQLDDPAVRIITDRLASRPIWWARDGGRFFASRDALQVAKVLGRTELDEAALASYLLYGTQVDPSRSVFRGVRSQPEGTVVRHSLAGAAPPEIHRWYRFDHRPDHGKKPREWAADTAAALRASARRTAAVTPDPLVFMSGGLDSRITAAALAAVGEQPLLHSIGDSDNTEIRVAKRVAKILDCRHHVHYRDPEYYLRALQRTSAYSHGSHFWIHGHFAEAYSEIQNRESVGGAFLGDFCEAFSKLCYVPPASPDSWRPDTFVRDFDSFPLANYAPADRNRTLALLDTDLRQEAECRLRGRISRRYEEAQQVSPEPLTVGDYFFRWQRSSCHATYQMFYDVRSAGPERNLMFDPEVHSLLERMPARIRSQERLGARVVRALHSGAAWVPDANSLVPVLAPGALHRFSKGMRPKLGKLRRRFVSDTFRTTASWPHIPLLMQRDEKWRAYLELLLFEGPLATHASFDHQEVRRSWDQFQAGDLERHHDIEKLLGLGQLLQDLEPNAGGG